jgi:hypothetical protein
MLRTGNLLLLGDYLSVIAEMLKLHGLPVSALANPL